MEVQILPGAPLNIMAKTKEEKNKYMADYMTARYHTRRNEAIIALGGKCAKCGSTSSLEFDHIDKSTKTFSIGKIFSTGSDEKVTSELAKCQLLCTPCHKEKNKIDNGEAKHGSLAMYTHYRCRCDICKSAWNTRSREYKAKRKTKERSSN